MRSVRVAESGDDEACAAAVARDTAGVRESLGPRAFLVRRQQARREVS